MIVGELLYLALKMENGRGGGGGGGDHGDTLSLARHSMSMAMGAMAALCCAWLRFSSLNLYMVLRDSSIYKHR